MSARYMACSSSERMKSHASLAPVGYTATASGLVTSLTTGVSDTPAVEVRYTTLFA